MLVNPVSRAAIAASGIRSGWSCWSTYRSTPIERTVSTSPARGPKPIRFSTWTIAWSSLGPVAAEMTLANTATAMTQIRFIAWFRQGLRAER